MEDQQEDSMINHRNNGKNVFIKAPREELTYKILIHILSILGLASLDYWQIPHKKSLALIYKMHGSLHMFAPLFVILQIMYIYVHFHQLDFYTLGVIFSVTPITLTICIKIFTTKAANFKRSMFCFMDKTHVYNKHIEEPNNEYIKSIVIQTEKLTRFTAFFLAACLVTDWTAWTFIPIVDYLLHKDLVAREEKKLETCLYVYAPFDYNYNVRNWIFIHSNGAYFNIGGICIVVTYDTLNFLFIFNLIGHLQILKHKMKEMNKISKITEKEMSKKLVEIIKYHSDIIGYFDDAQDTFGLNITANYMQNLFVDSLLLFQLMNGVNGEKRHFVIFGLMFLGYMGGLIFMSIVLEEIRRVSENFSDYIYELPWEDMSKRNQTTVLLIIWKMQPPLIFKGAGGLNTGVRPMIGIVKSTFSYYVMLNNKNAD